MSTPERDEHFQGFAKQQFDDVAGMFNRLFLARQDCDQAREMEATNDIQLYLARRAYDLALHTLLHVEHINLDSLSYEEHVTRIPDLTELSKEGETHHGS